MLFKYTKWPTSSEKEPGFAEMDTSMDIVQIFCDCGPIDDAFDRATCMATVFGDTAGVTQMTVQAAKDRVRRAIAACCRTTRKQTAPDKLDESQCAVFSTMSLPMHDLHQAVATYGAVVRDTAAPGIGDERDPDDKIKIHTGFDPTIFSLDSMAECPALFGDEHQA